MKRTEHKLSRKEFLILLAGVAQALALAKFVSWSKKIDKLDLNTALNTAEKPVGSYGGSAYGGKRL
jgi:hypothetical protein